MTTFESGVALPKQRPAATPGRRPRVVYGITSGMSARNLLRGQLAFLREQGWDVHLVCSDDDLAQAAATAEGVTLHPLPMAREISPLRDAKALLQWVSLLRSLRPDVLNVSTPKAGLLGGIAGLLTRVPARYYVLRGLRLEGSRGLATLPLWLAERTTMATATEVIAVSRTLATASHRRRLMRRGRALVIGLGSSNGVAAEAAAARAQAARDAKLRERLGFSSDDFVIGFTGRIVEDKGVGTLMRALDRLPASAKCLLVGPVEEPHLQAVIDGLGERAVQVGWTNDPWFYYGAMDVLVLPTRREGFPNVVIEAAAAGVPTIATTATGCPDAVVDGTTGLLFPIDDDEALAGCLRRLSDDPKLTRDLGNRARERALTQFTPQAIWNGLLSIYRGDLRNDATITRV